MSEEYTIEEIELTEGFAKHIYDWYVANRIVNHALSRADYVRAHNQRIQSIFSDLRELNFLIEQRDYNGILNTWAFMDEETREIVPFHVIDYIDKIRSDHPYVEQNDDGF